MLQKLIDRKETVGLTLSEQGLAVACAELGLNSEDPAEVMLGHQNGWVVYYPHDRFDSPFATGSQPWETMVIVPCSMGTVGRIAAGVSNDLITRAADVALKERRKLILVPRETPLNLIHLRNLTTLAEAGAVILPPSPGFYDQPQTLHDLVDFVVERILQAVGS
jgi:4-hydroxy-3-polyprenylbenzoate decarboxylase